MKVALKMFGWTTGKVIGLALSLVILAVGAMVVIALPTLPIAWIAMLGAVVLGGFKTSPGLFWILMVPFAAVVAVGIWYIGGSILGGMIDSLNTPAAVKGKTHKDICRI